MTELLEREADVASKALVKIPEVGLRPSLQFLLHEPLAIGLELLAQCPGMGGIGWIEGGHFLLLQRLANRLEVRLEMVLGQRFEEGHAEHFPFPFVDAGGEVLEEVLAEEVAAEEEAAAIGLHEHF